MRLKKAKVFIIQTGQSQSKNPQPIPPNGAQEGVEEGNEGLDHGKLEGGSHSREPNVSSQFMGLSPPVGGVVGSWVSQPSTRVLEYSTSKEESDDDEIDRY